MRLTVRMELEPNWMDSIEELLRSGKEAWSDGKRVMVVDKDLWDEAIKAVEELKEQQDQTIRDIEDGIIPAFLRKQAD